MRDALSLSRGAGDHHGASGGAGGVRPERGGTLRPVHQERGLPRNLSYLAGECHPSQHSGPDLLRPEPGVHGVLPGQRVRLRHHLHHPVRSGLCGGRRHIREYQPHRGRYFQQLYRAAGQRGAAVRPVLRRGAYPVRWPVPMGQRGSGGGGHDALRNFAVLLRWRHQSGDECAGRRERGLLSGAAPAAGRRRQRRADPEAAAQPHREELPRHPGAGRQLRL